MPKVRLLLERQVAIVDRSPDSDVTWQVSGYTGQEETMTGVGRAEVTEALDAPGPAGVVPG